MMPKICLAGKKDTIQLRDYFKKTVNDPKKFVANRIIYYLKNHFIVLAKDKEKQDKIIGHLFFQAKENPRLGVGEFEAMHVLEDYRGMGIGTLLCSKSVDYANDYFKKYNSKMRCLYLFTREDNTAAIKAYENAGFKKQSLVGKIFDSNAPDEVFMARMF